VRRYAASQLHDASADFLFGDQNRAQRRFHRAASLWYKPDRFQRGRSMRRIVYSLPVIFVLLGVFAFGQAAQNQQRNRVDDYGIRGKIVISNMRDFDQRIEVRLEKSAAQTIQTTYTDAAGNFDFRGLVPGAYYVS